MGKIWSRLTEAAFEPWLRKYYLQEYKKYGGKQSEDSSIKSNPLERQIASAIVKAELTEKNRLAQILKVLLPVDAGICIYIEPSQHVPIITLTIIFAVIDLIGSYGIEKNIVKQCVLKDLEKEKRRKEDEDAKEYK